MKKFLFSPLFAAFFTLAALTLYYIGSYIIRSKFGVFDIEESGATEVLTYVFYGFAIGVAACFGMDYLNTPRQKTYWALMILLGAALLREMGIQHWLTQHDTTAIKIRFFTNPNNPLSEKIITASIVLFILAVIIYLLVKYLRQMIIGFFKFQPLYWTIATFGALGITTQFVDRFPANYAKTTGNHLSEPIRFALKIFEEGGESLLPLLFAIGLIQFHFILRKKTYQTDDESKDIVPDSV